ncbi:MAG: hypothetical protein WDN44_12210 [Sphingomonas sp.]
MHRPRAFPPRRPIPPRRRFQGHRCRRSPPKRPKASLSRFQLLIFTFVIAGVYLVLCLESGTFVEMPQNVVLLLGVSGTTYAASKGIKAASDASGNS